MPRAKHHLSRILTETARRHPEKEALVFEKERLSWAEVERRVRNLAGAFLEMGVERGDRVGIYCTTRPEYIIAYLAAARVGAILVGFNVNYTVREIRETANIARPGTIIIYEKLDATAAVQKAVNEMPFVRNRLLIGEQPPAGWQDFRRLTRHSHPELDLRLARREAELEEDDGALMVFTGGVTGSPKGAVLTHRNIAANISAQNRNLGWRPEDRLILHLPMNHVSGATLLTVGAMMAGATLILLERFQPERTLALVEQEGVTILGQVPTMWIMEFGLSHFADYDLSSLRMTLVSGAPTPAAVMRRIASLAPEHYHAWGLTEATGMVTYNAPGDDVNVLLQSAGRPAPEFEVQIVDREGRPSANGARGEVVVRGECVMAGYFNNADETAGVIDQEGWLHTGDLGKFDDSRYLTLVGLLKNMYISGGYNVYPPEIETYLNQHPDIAASACFGAPHPIMGQTGSVYVLPKPGVSLSKSEVQAYCKRGLARYKRPQHIHIVEALPFTPDGAVDKARLQAEFGRSLPPAPSRRVGRRLGKGRG